jgi:hypothetical protein
MNRIFPPNDTMGRALFCWSKAELDSSTERNALAAFCAAHSITTVLLHFYQWIGGSNWTSTNYDNLRALLTTMNNAAVRVWGLIGGADYAVNQRWVRRNILGAVQAFNAASTDHCLEGLVFDNEYWTDPQTYDPQEYIPAYWTLMEAARGALSIPVGVFAQRNLIDSGRDTVDCRGLDDVEGAHLLAMSDFVMVGSYDSQAEPHGDYPGQIAMLEPWVARAAADELGTLVWGCSETKDVQPGWITYYGSTKAAMEAQHALIADALTSAHGTPYEGQAVHDYTAYKSMS